MSCDLEWMGNLGDLLTGIAAIIAIILAPDELKKWRTRRKSEEAAAFGRRLLYACTKLTLICKTVTNRISFGDADWNSRNSELEDAKGVYLEFYEMAPAALPSHKKLLSSLDEVWKLAGNAKAFIRFHISDVAKEGCEPPIRDLDAYEKKLDAAFFAVKESLRSIVNFDEDGD